MPRSNGPERVIAEASRNRRRTFALASFVGLQMAKQWDVGGINTPQAQRALGFGQAASATLGLTTMGNQATIQGLSLIHI